ncbi:response regulator transcription factor [Ramlibacter sp. AN1015]|uniref:response regulator n=1 Tax=Ramlibacter sp. AN1015 TaxID=3133428 RepID=UPI0030C47707
MASQPAPRVFLADDSGMIRSRLAALLDTHHMTVVGQAATPEGCIDGILASHPQVVVLDVQLEGGTGLQVLRAVRSAAPDIAFVVFSNNAGPAYRKRYLGEGAAFFLDKSREFEHLPTAIAEAGAGLAFLPH